MKMMKRMFRISNLKYLMAFLIPMVFVMLINGALDNDSWDVLAEGRYIAENGVYYTDVLSMHEGLEITVQNYGFAVVFWWIYVVFGAVGPYILMLVLNIAICFLLYKIYMILSKKNVNLALFAMIMTDILLAFGFVATRAQMVSFVIFLGLIYLLELYIKTGKKGLLWIAPILSLVQVNLHASLWLMLPIVMVVYIVDGIRAPKLHLQGYKIGPLVITLLIMLAVGLLNPYGIKMILFIVTSYGNTVMENLVNELHPFSFESVFDILIYMTIVATMILCIYGRKSRIRVRWLVMYFGFLALGLNTIKGMSQFILVALMPVVACYGDLRIERVFNAEIGRRAIVLSTSVVAASISVALLVTLPFRIENRPNAWEEEAVNMIDEKIREKGLDRGELTIYTGYNEGGYLEFRGYKPYLDPRGEVFVKKNNKKEDILQEYVDLQHGDIEIDEFLGKYNFDFLVVGNRHKMYELERSEYEMIYQASNDKIRVYQNISL